MQQFWVEIAQFAEIVEIGDVRVKLAMPQLGF